MGGLDAMLSIQCVGAGSPISAVWTPPCVSPMPHEGHIEICYLIFAFMEDPKNWRRLSCEGVLCRGKLGTVGVLAIDPAGGGDRLPTVQWKASGPGECFLNRPTPLSVRACPSAFPELK